MIFYITGPAKNRFQVDQLAGLASELHAAAQEDGEEVLIAFPNDTSSTAERLGQVCMADLVILGKGWETDVAARRDAQVAAWCDKAIRTDVGLRKAAPGGKDLPVLTQPGLEWLQDTLDRGMSLRLPMELPPRKVREPDEGGEAAG